MSLSSKFKTNLNSLKDYNWPNSSSDIWRHIDNYILVNQYTQLPINLLYSSELYDKKKIKGILKGYLMIYNSSSSSTSSSSSSSSSSTTTTSSNPTSTTITSPSPSKSKTKTKTSNINTISPPLKYVEIPINTFGIDFGYSPDDKDRGFWLEGMDKVWYKLEKPNESYAEIANEGLHFSNEYTKFYDSIVYGSGNNSKKPLGKIGKSKYVCDYTIKQIYELSNHHFDITTLKNNASQYYDLLRHHFSSSCKMMVNLSSYFCDHQVSGNDTESGSDTESEVEFKDQNIKNSMKNSMNSQKNKKSKKSDEFEFEFDDDDDDVVVESDKNRIVNKRKFENSPDSSEKKKKRNRIEKVEPLTSPQDLKIPSLSQDNRLYELIDLTEDDNSLDQEFNTSIQDWNFNFDEEKEQIKSKTSNDEDIKIKVKTQINKLDHQDVKQDQKQDQKQDEKLNQETLASKPQKKIQIKDLKKKVQKTNVNNEQTTTTTIDNENKKKTKFSYLSLVKPSITQNQNNQQTRKVKTIKYLESDEDEDQLIIPNNNNNKNNNNKNNSKDNISNETDKDKNNKNNIENENEAEFDETLPQFNFKTKTKEASLSSSSSSIIISVISTNSIPIQNQTQVIEEMNESNISEKSDDKLPMPKKKLSSKQMNIESQEIKNKKLSIEKSINTIDELAQSQPKTIDSNGRNYNLTQENQIQIQNKVEKNDGQKKDERMTNNRVIHTSSEKVLATKNLTTPQTKENLNQSHSNNNSSTSHSMNDTEIQPKDTKKKINMLPDWEQQKAEQTAQRIALANKKRHLPDNLRPIGAGIDFADKKNSKVLTNKPLSTTNSSLSSSTTTTSSISSTSPTTTTTTSSMNSSLSFQKKNPQSLQLLNTSISPRSSQTTTLRVFSSSPRATVRPSAPLPTRIPVPPPLQSSSSSSSSNSISNSNSSSNSKKTVKWRDTKGGSLFDCKYVQSIDYYEDSPNNKIKNTTFQKYMGSNSKEEKNMSEILGGKVKFDKDEDEDEN